MHNDIILYLSQHQLQHIEHHSTLVSLNYFIQITIKFIIYFNLIFLLNILLGMGIKISFI